jgi:hypothetical protein
MPGMTIAGLADARHGRDEGTIVKKGGAHREARGYSAAGAC